MVDMFRVLGMMLLFMIGLIGGLIICSVAGAALAKYVIIPIVEWMWKE